MQKITLVALMIIMIIGCAGLETVPKEERQMQVVYELPGMTKDEIFNRTLEWMAVTYVSSESVIEHSDKETGKIIGKGITDFYQPMGVITNKCRYTISIDIKDGKIRITFSSFVGLFSNGNKPLTHKVSIDTAKENLRILSEKLYSSLMKKEDDNW